MIGVGETKHASEKAVGLAAERNIVLDYSRSSVVVLDELLLEISHSVERQGLGDEEIWELACTYGSYLGECMLRNDFKRLGFAWGEDTDGEPCLNPTPKARGTAAHLSRLVPITKAYKRIVNWEQDSVAQFYATSLLMASDGDCSQALGELGQEAMLLEPKYVDTNGKVNASAAAWLFCEDVVFFLDEQISWDGKSHSILGIQLNAGKINAVPMLMSSYQSLLPGVADIISDIERDESLRVPLSMIHPGVHGVLRNEDLTGLTLFNLMACAHALIVKESKPDDYNIMCDQRLAMGIPSFYQLVARMIWDMRAYNSRTGVFRATFANARNIDADVFIGEVDEMVPGAFSQSIWQIEVAEIPVVELTGDHHIRSRGRNDESVMHICSNLLVITGVAKNMRKALVQIAQNLSANGQGEHFDLATVTKSRSIKKIYDLIEPVASEHYLEAMAVNPESQGFDYEAEMGLNSYGDIWILTDAYDTVSEPNSTDLDTFFQSLPRGEFGVALFSASDRDSYGGIDTFATLHHGRARLRAVEPPYVDSALSAEELGLLKTEQLASQWYATEDLAELAYRAAANAWDDDSHEYDDEYDYQDCLRYSWSNLRPKDVDMILAHAKRIMTYLPSVFEVEWVKGMGSSWTGKEDDPVEALFPGDVVSVRSEWTDTEPIALLVLAPDGSTLGQICSWRRPLDVNWSGGINLDVLTLVLPYLSATVFDMTTISSRGKGASKVMMRVQLETRKIGFDEVVSGIRETLSKRCRQRSVSSYVEEKDADE